MIVQSVAASRVDVNKVLERAMDAAALREQVLSNNIANIDTPGFKRSDIDFNATLRQAMGEAESGRRMQGRRTRVRHIVIPQGGAHGSLAQQETWYVRRNDESNAGIEVENASRDQNQILYRAAAQLYGDRMKWLGIVLDSRR